MNPHKQCVESCLHQTFCTVANRAYQKRFRLVAVPAIDDRRDIHIDNVTIFQRTSIRDAVADDFIDTRTNGLRISKVS